MKDFYWWILSLQHIPNRLGGARIFSEIIEIGAVRLKGEDFAEAGKIQNFVKPHFYPKQAKDSMDFA